eukprot:TRINITY_DN23532_c0_g1_i1.p1 TRINITY_DN23532_c0_g1~~TRINITY_DN23532_c0_g1_i1.p1  ORF type:complete len:872 (+),score=247.69 TRINITY_DN23532_c0_g1_i1:68-2683(+)
MPCAKPIVILLLTLAVETGAIFDLNDGCDGKSLVDCAKEKVSDVTKNVSETLEKTISDVSKNVSERLGEGGKKIDNAVEMMANCTKGGTSLEECRKSLGGGILDRLEEKKAALMKKLKLVEGAPSALGDTMKSCKDSKDVCLRKAKAAMEKLLGKNVTKADVVEALEKAGAGKASEDIRKCIQGASNEQSKRECRLNDAARELMAAASGKRKEDITDFDLRKGFKQNTVLEVASEVKGCLDSASDAAAKKACFHNDAIKEKIAGAEGKAKTMITDSEMRQYFMKGARDSVLTMLESCSEEDMESCKQQAKEELAKLEGRNVSSLSDTMLELEAKGAMIRSLGDKMRACAEDAGDKAAAKQCRTELVKSSLNKAMLGKGKGVSNVEVAMAMADVAKEKAKEIGENCKLSRSECMKLLKEEMATSLGANVSDMEIERINLEGAMEAAKNVAKACAGAKKEDPSATCDSPFKKFEALNRRQASSDAKRRGADENLLKGEIAKGLKKDAMKMCFESATKTDADACLASLKAEADDVTAELFKSLPAKVREAAEKRTKHAAKLELVGERFHACMKGASTSEEKTACMTDIANKTKVAGILDDPKKVAMRFRGKLVSQAASSCDASKREACLEQAKEELVKTGVKARAFGQLKKLAVIKAAAETWVACKENSTNSDDACDDLAMATLKEQSGASDGFLSENKDQVKKLAQTLLDGGETLLRKLKRVDIDVDTDGASCQELVADKIAAALNDGIKSIDTAKTAKRACDLVFGKANYGASVVPLAGSDNEESIEAISDTAAATLSNNLDLNARRLGSRRLEAVTNAYADQAVEECSASDPSCKDESTTSNPASFNGAVAMNRFSLLITVLVAWACIALV